VGVVSFVDVERDLPVAIERRRRVAELDSGLG
jgi:hypothetical protein